MNRRDYELICRVIRDQSKGYSKTPKTPLSKKQLVNDFSAALKEDNANFNAEKFKKACGI